MYRVGCDPPHYKIPEKKIRSKKEWIRLKDGIEITEFEYQSPEWKKPRRMVAVRKNIEILTKATGKLLLFDEPVGRYRYRVYVTNLDLPAEQIWLSYKDRADAENRIKELKYDFGLDSFCLDNKTCRKNYPEHICDR